MCFDCIGTRHFLIGEIVKVSIKNYFLFCGPSERFYTWNKEWMFDIRNWIASKSFENISPKQVHHDCLSFIVSIMTSGKFCCTYSSCGLIEKFSSEYPAIGTGPQSFPVGIGIKQGKSFI